MPEPRAKAKGAAAKGPDLNPSPLSGTPEEIVDSLLSRPADEALSLISLLPFSADVERVTALSLLALSTRADLGVRAAEELGAIRTDGAAEALDRVAARAESKAVQKAARRSLYRLSSQGIKVAPTVQESPATTGSRAATLYRCVASSYDGSGTRAMWFAAERPLGGIYMIAVTINDVIGMTDCHVRDTTRKRFTEQETKMRETDPMAWVELPIEYGKQLIAEAIGQNREERQPVPPSYTIWADLIGNPEEPFERALVYNELSAMEARLHPTLERETPRLFEQAEIEPWFAPPSMATKWARQMANTTTSRLLVTAETDGERQERILKEAIKELFPPKALRGLRRRLEETAYILLRTDREQDARRAVAAAATIEDLRPLQPPHPFVRALGLRSLQIAYEVDRSGVEPARLALAPRG